MPHPIRSAATTWWVEAKSMDYWTHVDFCVNEKLTLIITRYFRGFQFEWQLALRGIFKWALIDFSRNDKKRGRWKSHRRSLLATLEPLSYFMENISIRQITPKSHFPSDQQNWLKNIHSFTSIPKHWGSKSKKIESENENDNKDENPTKEETTIKWYLVWCNHSLPASQWWWKRLDLNRCSIVRKRFGCWFCFNDVRKCQLTTAESNNRKKSTTLNLRRTPKIRWELNMKRTKRRKTSEDKNNNNKNAGNEEHHNNTEQKKMKKCLKIKENKMKLIKMTGKDEKREQNLAGNGNGPSMENASQEGCCM